MTASIIYLMGVDGSGKSTVAEHMKRHLRAQGYRVRSDWVTLRPVLLVPFIKAAKYLIVRKHNKYDNYTEHIEAKNKARGWFRLFLQPLFFVSFLDYIPQYFWKVVRPGWMHDYLICDRYYPDMIMERAILVGAGARRFPEWLRRYGRFFRKPDLVLYIRTSPEVAFRRKTDIPSEAYLSERMTYYDATSEILQARIIDGDQPLDAVLVRVVECMDRLDR